MNVSPRLVFLGIVAVLLGGMLYLMLRESRDPVVERAYALSMAIDGNHRVLADLLKRDPSFAVGGNKVGVGMLHLAAMSGSPETIALVLSTPALRTPDALGKNPLHYWAERASSLPTALVCAQALVDAGIDLNAATQLKQTPLHFAVGQASEPVIAWMLDKGANPSPRDVDGRTPLDYIAKSETATAAAIVKLLKSRGGVAGSAPASR